MRQIKVRAWHTKMRRMFSAEELGRDQLTLSADGRGFVNVSGKDLNESVFYGEVMIPLEYIGLDDNKDVEIFEGDIVDLDSWEGVQQIAFIEGAFCLADADGAFVGDIHYCQHAYRNQATVIGDIYQNPELLDT